MLADWATTDAKQVALSQRLRTCFSLWLVAASLLAGPFASVFALACGTGDDHARCCQATAASHAEQSDPAQQTLVTPHIEISELYPPTNLRFENDHATIAFWQPLTLASSRIIPRGLVLSYLCDSARHQCSGVQLA